jgi:hypothetical protein
MGTAPVTSTAADTPRLRTTANLHANDYTRTLGDTPHELPGGLRSFAALQREPTVGAGGAQEQLSVRGHRAVDCEHEITDAYIRA